MPRSEAQVEHSDDQALASFASDVERFKINDGSHLRKLTKACLSNQSFVAKTRAAFEAEQQVDPTSFDGSSELGQWPTKGKPAVFRDPKDGLVEYVFKAVVELPDVAGMDWRPLKTNDLKAPVVDSTANDLANQANYDLAQDLNAKYTGKLYKCAFCSKTARTSDRWRIRQHMAKCTKSDDSGADPIEVNTVQWSVLNKFRVPGTAEEQTIARRMRNQRYYSKKKAFSVTV